jgi:Zn-dependent protease
MLAVVDYRDPLLWAAFIGWIMSVVLHEFAHGVVAYWGGDYTIRERGGLTLNPFQYIDPVFSILIPAVIFVMGGVPLPGGVTYVRRDLIRTRFWQVATSAAGPAMNFVIFLLLVLPMHPSIGWIHPKASWITGAEVEKVYVFMGAMAVLQMLAVLFNLVPVPPLDGFQIVAEFLDDELRQKLMAISGTLFIIFCLILWNSPQAFGLFFHGVEHTLEFLGFDEETIFFIQASYFRVLFGHV